MSGEDRTAASRYDAEGRCLDCGGVGGCHSLDCPPMAAKYDEAERSAACALCGKPLEGEPVDEASDGALVHQRCEAEYEDIVYFREFEGSDDAD